MKVLSKNLSISLPVVIVVMFAGLMLTSSLIRIPVPFSPVPLTMQTLILFLGIAMLKKKAAIAQTLYVIMGSAAGLVFVAGPTGGYILGFIAASIICPYLMPEKKSFAGLFLLFGLANVIVYFSGISWLVALYRLDITAAITAGVLPFLVSDLLKIAIAATLCSRVNFKI